MDDGKKLHGVGEGGMVHQDMIEDQAVVVAADKSSTQRRKPHDDGGEKNGQDVDGGALNKRSCGDAVTGHVDRPKNQVSYQVKPKRRRTSLPCKADRSKL